MHKYKKFILSMMPSAYHQLLPLLQSLLLCQCPLSPSKEEQELKGNLRSIGAAINKWIEWYVVAYVGR